jgi:hypothetical protein
MMQHPRANESTLFNPGVSHPYPPVMDLIEREITESQINLASIQEMEIDFDELLDYVESYLESICKRLYIASKYFLEKC